MRRFFKLTTLGRVATLSATFLVLDAWASWAPWAPLLIPRNGRIFPRAGARARPGGAAESEAAHFERSQPALLQAEVARLAPPQRGQRMSMPSASPVRPTRTCSSRSLTADWRLSIASCRSAIARCDSSMTATLGEHCRSPASSNFAAAVHAVGATSWTRTADVLVLLMTSHGDRNGFALQLPDTATSELTPQEVAADPRQRGHQEPHRDRVGLLFRNIRAAACQRQHHRADRRGRRACTSFGCAPERDWTYFGDAFFRQSLRPGTDLQQRLRPRPHADPRLGNDGPRAAVKSARRISGRRWSTSSRRSSRRRRGGNDAAR